MSKKNQARRRIHAVYGILLSVLIVASGICLILSCIEIYKSGASPFTRESIGQAFAKIAVPVYVCLGGIVIGIVLSLVLPVEAVKLRGGMEAKKALARLYTRINFLACDREVREKLKKESHYRITVRVFLVLICVAAAIPLLIYLCNASNFTMELNASVMGLAYMAIPFVLIAGLAALCATVLEQASIKRETAMVKELIALGTAPGWNCKPVVRSTREGAVWAVRIVIIVLGTVLVILGLFNGGMKDVLGKAIKICTECIGLG